jgi:hypothetical protein
VDTSANGNAFNAKMDSLKDISKTVKKLSQKFWLAIMRIIIDAINSKKMNKFNAQSLV